MSKTSLAQLLGRIPNSQRLIGFLNKKGTCDDGDVASSFVDTAHAHDVSLLLLLEFVRVWLPQQTHAQGASELQAAADSGAVHRWKPICH